MPAKILNLNRQHPFLAALNWETPAAGKAAPKRFLALHGWLDNAESFSGVIQHLRGVQIVALDFPGHGYSEHRSPDAHYHFLDWVPDVLRAADELGWERFGLIGHSMGAAVACLTAGTYPERIERLIAIEGLTPQVATSASLPERLRVHMDERARIPNKIPAVYPTVEHAAAARLKASDLQSSNALLEAMVERGLKKTKDGYSWRADPRLRAPSAWRLTLGQARAFLRRIDCPTMLIRATKGIAANPQTLTTSMKCIRNLQFHELAGGHHLHLECPEVVAKTIQNFIES